MISRLDGMVHQISVLFFLIVNCLLITRIISNGINAANDTTGGEVTVIGPSIFEVFQNIGIQVVFPDQFFDPSDSFQCYFCFVTMFPPVSF